MRGAPIRGAVASAGRGMGNEPQSAGRLFCPRTPRPALATAPSGPAGNRTRTTGMPYPRHTVRPRAHVSTLSVEPRGVEPRRRVCKTQLSPASDPGIQWTRGELHPDFSRAKRASSCWTTAPSVGAFGRRVTPVGLEPTRLTAAGSQPTLTTSSSTRSSRSTVAQEGLAPSRRSGTGF